MRKNVARPLATFPVIVAGEMANRAATASPFESAARAWLGILGRRDLPVTMVETLLKVAPPSSI
jgi:hypothetical protein